MRFSAPNASCVVLSAVLTLFLAACGQSQPAAGCGDLAVDNAWLTPVSPGSREMLGYMTLHNDGSADVVVHDIASADFDRAIFQDKTAADTAGVKPLAPFTVAAGKTFELVPNEREIALYSPSRAYHTGDRVKLSLVCGTDKARLDTVAVVRSGGGDDVDLPPTDEDTRETEQALKKPQAGGPRVSATDDSKTADKNDN